MYPTDDLSSQRQEVLALNPNTGTLPMFRTRRDAEITLGIYSRHPVLIREDDPNGNQWDLSLARACSIWHLIPGLFHTVDDLDDAKFNGWSYKRGNKEFVPLYESKMPSVTFDHRY